MAQAVGSEFSSGIAILILAWHWDYTTLGLGFLVFQPFELGHRHTAVFPIS